MQTKILCSTLGSSLFFIRAQSHPIYVIVVLMPPKTSFNLIKIINTKSWQSLPTEKRNSSDRKNCPAAIGIFCQRILETNIARKVHLSYFCLKKK
jgi:hypothetical protein